MTAPLQLHFADADAQSVPSGRKAFRLNRFGGDPAQWSRNANAWSSVEYSNVAAGVDLQFTPQVTDLAVMVQMQGKVRANGNLDLFVLRVGDGSRGVVTIDQATGDARITGTFFTVGLQRPVAWQDLGIQRVQVSAAFKKLDDGTIGFAVGSYDKSFPLTIQTALGNGLAPQPAIAKLQADRSGNLFVGGAVESHLSCGLTTGGTFIPCTDAWIAGVQQDGTLQFLTRIEGSLEETISDFAWRDSGDLIVTGNTASADYPVTADAIQKQNAGPLGPKPRTLLGYVGDAFLARIDAATGDLLYSTYFGNPVKGENGKITLAGDKPVLVLEDASASLSVSPDAWMAASPCAGVSACGAGAVIRFNSTLTQVERASFLPRVPFQNAIGGYADGSVMLATSVRKEDPAPPLVQALQSVVLGDSDVYILRLNAALTAPIYATFYGGPGNENPVAALADAGGGATMVVNTRDAAQASRNSIVELSPDGRQVVSVREVGSGQVSFRSLLRLEDGRLLLAGSSSEATLPMSADAPLPAGCIASSEQAGVLYLLNRDGSSKLSTYLPDGSGSGVGLGAGLTIWNPQTDELSRINTDKAATPNLACVTGAASRRTNGIAPGQIVTLVGTGMGPQSGVGATLTENRMFPLALADVTVRVNGVAAPLLYAQSSQINAVVPYEAVVPNTTATIEVVYNGHTLRTTTTTKFTGVELFTMDYSGAGQAVALNQNGTLNSAENPAAPGSVVVLYGTGIGLTNPRSVTGALAPVEGPNALARPEGPVVAFIGGRQAEVIYAGAAPGLINGAAQFNLRVPSELSGAAGVSIRINGSLPGNAALVYVR